VRRASLLRGSIGCYLVSVTPDARNRAASNNALGGKAQAYAPKNNEKMNQYILKVKYMKKEIVDMLLKMNNLQQQE
jgi:hypothetical protein